MYEINRTSLTYRFLSRYLGCMPSNVCYYVQSLLITIMLLFMAGFAVLSLPIVIFFRCIGYDAINDPTATIAMRFVVLAGSITGACIIGVAFGAIVIGSVRGFQSIQDHYYDRSTDVQPNLISAWLKARKLKYCQTIKYN